MGSPVPGTLPNGMPPGIGNPAEATQATAFMQQQPWYQEWLVQNGLPPSGPGNGVKLTDSQRSQLMALALKNGIGLNHKYDMIDENGQVAEEHHKLKKVAIAAAIAGLALTGFGAAGIGPLAGALGGAASATTTGGVLASHAIPAVSGIGALVPATVGTGAVIGGTGAAIGAGSALAGLAPLASSTIGTGAMAAPIAATVPSAAMAGGAIPGAVAATGGIGGIGGAINTGMKIANLAGKVGSTLSNAQVGADGNPINAPQTSADADRAQALTNNRYLGAPIDQAGVAADTGSMRNMLRAGLIARMDPNAPGMSVGGYALPNLAPSAQGVDFHKSFQDQMSKRMANGQPLTLSGVPAASKEELDAQQSALNATGATGSTGAAATATKVGNVINQGVKYAQMGKSIYDAAKGWWS